LAIVFLAVCIVRHFFSYWQSHHLSVYNIHSDNTRLKFGSGYRTADGSLNLKP